MYDDTGNIQYKTVYAFTTGTSLGSSLCMELIKNYMKKAAYTQKCLTSKLNSIVMKNQAITKKSSGHREPSPVFCVPIKSTTLTIQKVHIVQSDK